MSTADLTQPRPRRDIDCFPRKRMTGAEVCGICHRVFHDLPVPDIDQATFPCGHSLLHGGVITEVFWVNHNGHEVNP